MRCDRTLCLFALFGTLTQGFAFYPLRSVAASDLPDGGELFRKAVQVTEWVEEAESVRMEVSTTFRHTPAAIEARKRRYAREDGERFDPTHPIYARQLRSEEQGTLRLAWDANRIMSRVDIKGSMQESTVWSNDRGYHDLQFVGAQPGTVALSASLPQALRRDFFSWLPWSQTGYHPAPARFRDDSPEMRANHVVRFGKQVAWKCWGQVEFDGVPCWLVHRDIVGDWTRYYIECETGQFRGVRDGTWGIAFAKATAPLLVRELKARGFANADEDSAEQLVDALPAEIRLEIQKRLEPEVAMIYGQVLPQLDWIFETVLSDYREIAPGRFFPMCQVFSMQTNEGPHSIVEETREFQITRLDVDRSLDDEVFSWTISDGTEVYDTTGDVPIRYRQDSRRADDEWQELLKKAREARAIEDARNRAWKALVGQPAPAWPTDVEWINSEPTSWEQLRGHWVLLDFWDIGCGPCWGHQGIPYAEAVFRNELKSELPEKRLVVISIHRSGRTADQIEKAATERLKSRLQLPIVIDQSVPEPMGEDPTAFPGELFQAYAISRIPFALLIDPMGKVAEYGDLQTVHSKAQSNMRGASKGDE